MPRYNEPPTASEMEEMSPPAYIFSADHVLPDWRFENEPISVSCHRGYGDSANPIERADYYSANHARLGCSKGAATPEAAIRGMVAEHGCTNIRVEVT